MNRLEIRKYGSVKSAFDRQILIHTLCALIRNKINKKHQSMTIQIR